MLARWLWLVFALLCASAPVARADTGIGLEIGLRAGYGLPLGKLADDGGDLNELVSGQIPLLLEVGYRVIPSLSLGIYGQYGFGFVGDELGDGCDASTQVSCSATDIRLGIQGLFHAAPKKQLDPWFGLGFGYEWLTLSVEGGGVETSITPSGFEFVSFQAGLDIQLGERFVLGPFLSFSLAQYADLSTDCSGAGISGACDAGLLSGEIRNKTLHEWLMFGLRGVLGL